MARATRAQSIESQIASYVSNLSASRKQAVLTVAKTFAEEEDAEFEREWAEGITSEELKKRVIGRLRSLEWKKK